MLTADDFEQALFLLEHTPEIDAVVTDYHLRGAATGADILVKATELQPAGGRVLTSALLPQALVTVVLRNGTAHRFVTKVCISDGLHGAIDEAIAAAQRDAACRTV